MMKRLFFVMTACAAICACNSKEDIVKPNINDQLDGDVAYLTVRIKDAGTQTRGTTGGFAYGSADERNVSSANFYFYDDNGDYITYGTLGNVSGTVNPADPVGYFEWSSNTVVAVWGLTDAENFPTKMVTVLNQPANFVGTHKSLSEMAAALAGAIYNESGDFVMSTSVYEDGNNGVVNYTTLKTENFAKEPIDVDGDYGRSGGYTAVDVYVERLAAKVGMTLNSTMYDGGSGTLDSTTINGYTAYDFTNILTEQFMDGVVDENNPVYVAILGWDIDATARDSYMLKNIDDYSYWSDMTFVWNGASYSRSYWAESPNYGVNAEYPTSSNGNSDAEEDTTPLNQYLKYTSLTSPIAFGSYGYCGENTNTVDVLGDEGSTAITNAIIKAQAYTTDGDGYTPLDIVEWHGEYYTAEDFCQTVVADVIDYDFTVVVDEVIDAMKDKYPDLSTYLDALNDCIIKDNVYVIPAVTDHLPNSGNVNGNQTPQKFGGSLLSLYNVGDGNVDLFFKGAQPYTGAGTEDDPFAAVGSDIIEKYPDDAIVYGGADLDDYEFLFEVEEEGLGVLELMGLIAAHVIFQLDGYYYMILGNNFYFETSDTGDPNFSGNHTYTLRNFLLRAITVEADGINSEFGSLHPNLFKDGLMYYHTPIEHLGTASNENPFVEGQYGVVRNHWYNINVTYFSRLGRGIADENEVIVPQPDLDYYYLGTDINIQSWQMITQEVGF